MERGLTKNQVVAELTKSPHGKLETYLPVATQALREDPQFYAHLIAWNALKGAIRDSKVALPVIGVRSTEPAFRENALAHLALLRPRELERAVRFHLANRASGTGMPLRRLVRDYLLDLEADWFAWTRTAVQHRATLKTLYAIWHTKPAPLAEQILFRQVYPPGSIFEAIATLGKMSATEAAGTILERKIPFLIAVGALGAKAKEPDLVMALMERMSPQELVNNSKMLERLGVRTVPALRAAYEQALARAAGSKKAAALKTTAAVEAVEDEVLKEKLKALQEKQIKVLGGVDGNWLVLGDNSGSMSAAIELARRVAATLAKVVKGDVHLMFFNTAPQYINATGKTYDELLAETQHITAGGGTSIGCGLLAALDKKLEIDGIAIVSDGGENTNPLFPHVYGAFSQSAGKQVPVYLYRTRGEPDVFTRNMQILNFDLQVFDLTGGVDYYSLPNLIQTMRVNRYSLIDEIMDVPLLTIAEVLKNRKEQQCLTA